MSELEKILQENKMKKLTEKISKMSPCEYEQFMNTQIKKIQELEDQVLENNKKIQTIHDIPKRKKITDSKTTLICSISTMSCMLIGAGLGIIYGNPETGNGAVGVFAGLGVGLCAMVANIQAYEKRPVSNYLNKVKIKVLESKNKKLLEQKNMEESLIK